ncbi:MAG: ImmA/IrrE family metallo-endopeptidase [Verrucomicrobiota bacterium]
MPERQRFTIFHEFAHTLFPDYCEFMPLHQSETRKLPDAEREFEYLCDLGAAEMLLPGEDFLKDLNGHQPLGFEVVHTLRKRYEASIDATTHRLVELASDVPCAAVFLTDQKGSFEGRGPLWVKYAATNRDFKSFIRPGTLPPWKSVAVECFRHGIETTAPAKETWWIPGRDGQKAPRTWLVQAAKLPTIADNPDYAKVVALLFPSGYSKLAASGLRTC